MTTTDHFHTTDDDTGELFTVRKEVWPELVQRVTDGSLDFVSADHWARNERERLFAAIYNMNILPAGRHLWVTGTDNRYSRNCFSYDTEVTTRQGIRKIGELAGTTVEILDGNGAWVQAECKSFGVQPLMELVVGRFSDEKTIYATADHGWFVHGSRGNKYVADQRLTTAELRAGHKLVSIKPRQPGALKSHPSPVGIQHGFVYGDGSLSSQGHNQGSVAYFCGEKDGAMLKWFPAHRLLARQNGVLSAPDNPRAWKSLPDINESHSYLLGWLAGYVAADGCVDSNGTVIVNSSKRSDLEFVRDVAAVLGIPYSPIHVQSRLGYGSEPTDLFRITLDPHALTGDFFLIPAHREAWELRIARSRPQTIRWEVKSVQPTDRVEEVYCFEVLTTRSFSLADGILTSNCFVAPWSSHLSEHFVWLFLRLMEGGGVGSNYSHDLISVLPPITARLNVEFFCDQFHPDHASMEQYLTAGVPSVADYDMIIDVDDAREGWGDGIGQIIDAAALDGTKRIAVIVSRVRRKGAPLKTMGGTASGPEPLVRALAEIVSVLSRALGRQLDWRDCMDIDHATAAAVVAGGTRRSARMAMLNWADPSVFAFITCKADHMHHWSTNISVEIDEAFFEALNDPTHPMHLHASTVLDNVAEMAVMNGEPGFFNSALANLGETNRIRCSNPCVTGDTLIAVADGRGVVRIDELAAAGNDVPVYTWDGHRPVIRTMRSPRKTGAQVPVFKVLLDSGDSITVTGNHKLILRDGTQVRADELVGGESLRLLSRYQSSFMPGGEHQSRRQPYWFVTGGEQTNKGEHRMISEFHLGRRLDADEVVHHVNRLGIDNRWENLEVMTAEEHDRHHAEEMVGGSNPMVRGFAGGEFGADWQESYRAKMSEAAAGDLNGRAYDISHEEIREHAVHLTAVLGRHARTDDWNAYVAEHGIPLYFTGWRRAHLNGGIAGLLTWAALDAGYFTGLHPHTERQLRRLVDAGYDASVIDGRVVIAKRCEVCDAEFTTVRTEHGICSAACRSLLASHPDVRQRAAETCKATHRRRHEGVRAAQVEVFRDLLPQVPSKKQWQQACRDRGVSPEISRKSSPFRTWEELVETAVNVNHKVVSVESAGFADVYNGTVDEFHSYFAGGWESTTRSGKPKQQFVLNANCGEIALEEGESCNLGHVNLANFVGDNEGAEEQFRLVTRFLVRATMNTYPDARAADVEGRNRRIGVGILGFQEWLVGRGVKWSESATDKTTRRLLNHFREVVREEADRFCDELGIPRCIKVTTVAPTGTISQLAGVTSGIHPVLFRYFIRNVRYSDNDPALARLASQGYVIRDDIYAASTKVVSFPVLDPIVARFPDSVDLIEEQGDLSVDQMLAVQAMVQETWCGGDDGNGVSFTVNMPAGLAPDDAREALRKWLPHLKGTTLFPNESRPMSPYEPISQEFYLSEMDRLGLSVAVGAGDLSCKGAACPVR